MGAATSESYADGRNLQRLVDTLADALFVLEMNDAGEIQIVYANAASESVFGAPAQQCVTRLISDLLPPTAERRFVAEFDRCRATRQPIEFRLELGDKGRAFGIKLNAIEEDDGPKRIVALARPASVHSGLEHDPGAEQFRVIAEHAADFISRSDPAGRLLYVNPAVERLLSASSASLAGKDVSEWGAPEHHERYREAIRRVVETGNPQMLELDIPDPPTGRVVYHQVRFAPEWAPNGELRSVIGIGRDITQLKAAEAELRLLNATLEERVAARTLDLERANRDLRSFASTVSHDLRAPLRAICGYANIIAASERERLSAHSRSLLERVALATVKLDHLINGILAYSKAGQSTFAGEWVAMTDVAREVVDDLIQQSSATRVDIAELPPAHVDITMARQILQNLIGNALKFSADNAQPRVEIGWFEQHGQVVYYVCDNGVGFDMQYADKLCSMFHRLHREDEFPGSGVGLAIVKRLVERHGGNIWAESAPGAGATFYFTLSAQPRTANHSRLMEPGEAGWKPPRHSTQPNSTDSSND